VHSWFFGVKELCDSHFLKPVFIAQHCGLTFPLDNIVDNANFWWVKEYFAYLDNNQEIG
jgi:hypothetical protein